MAGDCFLIGLAPVLVHMSKVDGKFPFHPVSINLLVEVAKTLFASAVLCLYVRPRASFTPNPQSIILLWRWPRRCSRPPCSACAFAPAPP